jgi:Ca2+-binding RTX toxin-like protein
MWGRVVIAAGASVAVLGGQIPAAEARTGTHRNEVFGTSSADRLVGTARDDLLGSRGGDDTVRPRPGADIVRAGAGDDYIFLTNDGQVDRIHCGGGFDVVAYRHTVDQLDIIDPNCEGIIA